MSDEDDNRLAGLMKGAERAYRQAANLRPFNAAPTPSTAEPSVERRAREILAAEYDEIGDTLNANRIRYGQYVCEEVDVAIRAITKALQSTDAKWECAAHKQSPTEPPECNWPMCGCDPHANRVVAAVEETITEIAEALEAVVASSMRNEAYDKARALLLKLKGQSQ